MPSAVERVRARAATPGGRRALRYAAVSVVSVLVSQVTLVATFAGFHWTARSSNVLACVVGGIPSYWLNRRWAWGKTGRSHWLRELTPFWTLAFIGLVFSTWAADFAESWSHDVSDSRAVQTVIVSGAVIGAFGVLWVVKFLFFNKVFVTDDEDLDAALADEVVA